MAEVKKLDPARLVNDASGWTDKKVGDVMDMHSYPGPGAPQPEPARAGVLGEFGGLGLAVPKHTWSAEELGLPRHGRFQRSHAPLRPTPPPRLGI